MPSPITIQGQRTLDLWRGAMWAALAVGALIYSLILYATFRFRKRGDRLPPQVHYNVPMEVLYTVVPFVLIGVLFYYTARDETFIDRLPKPDITIGVVGFQWSWQFHYYGQNLLVTGRPNQIPTLVLPINKKIEFIETSPDVDHSFWIPAFLFKRDVIPGHPNKFEVTITKTGTYAGRCAEFCGLYHSKMDFTLKTVTWSEYQRFLASAKAQAQTGRSATFTTPVSPVTAGAIPPIVSGGGTATNPAGSTP